MAACSFLLQLITLILHLTDISRSTNVIGCLASQCQDTTINCPDDGDECFISCSSPNACQNAIINCPKNQQCVISCDDINSCQNATFNGQFASTLDITACLKHHSCLDLTIYCPHYTTETNCFIEGNDNLGSHMQIYALNGWDDIDIDYNGTFNNNLRGTMYCNTNYDISCDIASDKWSCKDNNSRCNDMLSGENDIDHTENTIDLEMVIILTTLIAAVIFISVCCWHNNKSRHNTLSTTQTNPTATATAITNTNTIVGTKHNYAKGEKGVGTHTNDHHNTHTDETDHKIKIKNKNKNKPKSPKSKSITVSAQSKSTAKPAMPSEVATDVDTKLTRNGKRPKNTNKVKKNKNKKQIAVGGSINMVVQNGHNGHNGEEQPVQNIENIVVTEQTNNSEKDLNENALDVIDEQQASTPPKTEQGGYHGKYNFSGSSQLQFKPNISDSEPLTIKPTPGTWDMFEQENGILADQYNMDQMMGYLEEGAIACSYD